MTTPATSIPDCVRGDPGNLEYLQCLMTNLHKSTAAPRSSARWCNSRPAAKAALKKAIAQCNWDEASAGNRRSCWSNPWDVPTLTAMATACGGIMNQEGMTAAVTYGDCELVLPEVRLRHLSQRQARC